MEVGFKPSEKDLVSLRGVYNLPFNLDDPVYDNSHYIFKIKTLTIINTNETITS